MTESDLEYIVNSMPITKPAGFDEIRFRDIKHNIGCLKRVLLAIINGMLSTGNIPSKLKVSIVRPIYKKGNKKDIANYRPIALLPAISQIMEKFVLQVMTSFCDKFSLISNCQCDDRWYRHGEEDEARALGARARKTE